MIQELFRIGDFAISPFGLMLVVALMAAYAQLVQEMRRLDIGTEDDASAIIVACGLGGILGGKIYYAFLQMDWRTLFDRAGIVWYGSFLLGAAMLLWMIRRRGLPLQRTFDAAVPGLALGYGLGRIGCFLVGDDYGRPTTLPWGMIFKEGLPRTTLVNLETVFGLDVPPEAIVQTETVNWVRVHPTQLYETLLALLIWWILLRFARRHDPQPGSTFLLGLTLLSLERFGIEMLRAKDDRLALLTGADAGPFGALTVAQIISLLVLATVAVLAWRRRAVGASGGSEGAA